MGNVQVGYVLCSEPQHSTLQVGKPTCLPTGPLYYMVQRLIFQQQMLINSSVH